MPWKINPKHTSLALSAIPALIGAWQCFLTVNAYLSNHFFTHDVGRIDYYLYNTMHGHFMGEIGEAGSLWASHFTPTLLLLLPAHYLSGHVLSIPLLETLALASGAWATAWMTSGMMCRGHALIRASSPLPLALGTLLLASPLTGSLFNSWHYESFAVGLTLWALATLCNGHRRLFILFFLLSLGCKQDMAFYWGAFGLWWATFGKRINGGKSTLVSGLAMLLVSAAWLVAALGIIASFRKLYGLSGVAFAERYAWMGHGAPEVTRNLMANIVPVIVNIGYVMSIALPSTMWLTALAPSSILLLLPGAAIMGLTGFEPMHELYYYYSYPLLPFLFFGAALTVSRAARISSRFPRRRYWRVAGSCLLFAFVFWQLCQPTRTDGKYRLPEPCKGRQNDIRFALRTAIPPNASVTAQFDLLCQVPRRSNIYPLSETNIHRAEYWAMDTKGFLGDINSKTFGIILQEGQQLVQQGKARVVVNQDGFIILRRFDLSPGARADTTSNTLENARPGSSPPASPQKSPAPHPGKE